jgi:hypothetical protein
VPAREHPAFRPYTKGHRSHRRSGIGAREAHSTLEILFLLHSRLATTTMLFMAALGIWGLVSYARGHGVSGSFAGSLAIGQALVTVQVAAGALPLPPG